MLELSVKDNILGKLFEIFYFSVLEINMNKNENALSRRT